MKILERGKAESHIGVNATLESSLTSTTSMPLSHHYFHPTLYHPINGGKVVSRVFAVPFNPPFVVIGILKTLTDCLGEITLM